MSRNIMFIALAYLISGHVHSATLNIVGGQLIGASGVNVGGSLYDVEFVDGSCIALFDGCDSAVDDFAFQTLDSAKEASSALVSQVFGPGGFSVADPSLINGLDFPAPPPEDCISGAASCLVNQILTPFELFTVQNLDQVAASIIFIDFSLFDSYTALVGGGVNGRLIDDDVTANPILTYARWNPSPVPLPAAA